MTSLSKNDVFAPTTYTSVMAATIPTACSILLDDDLHKQQNLVSKAEPQEQPASSSHIPAPSSSSHVEICENNDAKLTKKTIPEPVHEKLSNKRNNHNNISAPGNLLDNNNSGSRKPLKTLESLSEKLPWKARRKKPTPVFLRNNSNSSTNSSSTSSYTCNLNNNLHNSKKSNIIIELSSTSSSTTSKDAEEEEREGCAMVDDVKEVAVREVIVEGEDPSVWNLWAVINIPSVRKDNGWIVWWFNL